jgi:hypothetical protein
MADIDELRELSNKIFMDINEWDNLSDSKKLEMMDYIKPSGTSMVDSKKVYANISIANWKDIRLKKVHTTALIGFVFRLLEEYDCSYELHAEKLRYKKFLEFNKNLDSEKIEKIKKEHEDNLESYKKSTKDIIYRFLSRNFEYDPDLHVRSSHVDQEDDSDKTLSKSEYIQKLTSLKDKSQKLEENLENNKDKCVDFLKNGFLQLDQTNTQTKKVIKEIIELLSNDMPVEDKQLILIKKYKALESIEKVVKPLVGPIKSENILNAVTIDPPQDVFHQFTRYLNNNYEDINDICNALYTEKPDIEFGITLHSVHKDPESAHEYQRQYADRIKNDMYTIESGATSLLGPFKENRNRINYYNKNTEVIKRMAQQLESDHLLGRDMMKKQIKVQKQKNILEAGPDSAFLSEYAKTMNNIKELGAKKGTNKEDNDKYEEEVAKAIRIKENYEVPDDAIQCNMFRTINKDGKEKMYKSTMYTASEEPLHLQKDSEYADKYQPEKTRTIISRKGEKKTITIPASAPVETDDVAFNL